MSSYSVVLHPKSYADVEIYRQALATGEKFPGARLARVLEDSPTNAVSTDGFITSLLATKLPQIFAESAVYGDGRDWNADELSLLGDIGIAAAVTVYDDGRHYRPTQHSEPFEAFLLYTPGALLRNSLRCNGLRCRPADWGKVTKDGAIDPAGYQSLYEQRLLPLFHFANEQAGLEGKQAFITVPGLGCGQFAGPFVGQLGAELKVALKAILERHATELPNFRVVYFDPYQECSNEDHEISGISFRVRPLTQGNQTRPQLCRPEHYQDDGDDFSRCLLFSLVAWDHVSWPGNDFYAGARATDDGVKAAATNSMQVMTGLEGQYNPVRSQYEPPAPFSNWEGVVKQQRLKLQAEDRLRVLPAVR